MPANSAVVAVEVEVAAPRGAADGWIRAPTATIAGTFGALQPIFYQDYLGLEARWIGIAAVIIIADDKRENLDAVMETFAGSGSWVHAWHYTREDAAVAAFDGGEAARQWDALRPALETVEGVFGADNFSLPPLEPAPGCD